MDWTRSIDAYCERTGPGLWAEPVNTVTNLAFLLAAALMWRRCRGMPTGQAMAALLFLVGLGSLLFHMLAVAWAAALDSLSILAFVIFYLWRANRDFLGLGGFLGTVLSIALLPLLAALAAGLATLPFFSVSAGYWPLPILILAYAVILRREAALASGLATGAFILAVSLVFRSLDAALCPDWPIGMHWVWHVLNAVMLGWMIEIWRRRAARLAGAPAKG